jgi:cytochrome c oxidase subunit II
MGIINRLLGINEVASEHGPALDNMLEFVHWVMLILAVGWSVFIALAIWKFRKSQNPKASYHGVTNHASSHIEVAVILVECVLLLGFAYPLWIKRVDVNAYPSSDPNVVKVRAVGEKFFWTYHYPGADGQFGRIDYDTVNNGNELGIDPADPNGKDDVKSRNQLTLPVGRSVIIEISAKDVIHALHLVPLRMQHDAIPGTPASMWFRTTKEVKDSDIVCGQLCGPGHAVMVSKLNVVPEKAFEAFLKENAPTPPVEAPKTASN